MTDAKNQQFESSHDTAARVEVSPKTIRRWIASGELAGYRAGPRLVRVKPDEVNAMPKLIPTANKRPFV